MYAPAGDRGGVRDARAPAAGLSTTYHRLPDGVGTNGVFSKGSRIPYSL